MSEANNGAAGIGAADIAGADAADETVIRIEDLRKTFGDNEVLRGIDLDVRRGEVVVILGPSGSGKSTLLRCVNLLEKPTGGRIFFEDTEITAKKTDINKVRAKVGMVFQNFNLFPHLTAKKNVMLSLIHISAENIKDVEMVGFDEMTAVFLALQSGQIDAIAVDLPVANYYVKTAYTDCQVIKEIPTGEQYAIAVSKDSPELTKALNTALKAVRENGKYDELAAKWLQ